MKSVAPRTCPPAGPPAPGAILPDFPVWGGADLCLRPGHRGRDVQAGVCRSCRPGDRS